MELKIVSLFFLYYYFCLFLFYLFVFFLSFSFFFSFSEISSQFLPFYSFLFLFFPKLIQFYLYKEMEAIDITHDDENQIVKIHFPDEVDETNQGKIKFLFFFFLSFLFPPFSFFSSSFSYFPRIFLPFSHFEIRILYYGNVSTDMTGFYRSLYSEDSTPQPTPEMNRENAEGNFFFLYNQTNNLQLRVFFKIKIEKFVVTKKLS